MHKKNKDSVIFANALFGSVKTALAIFLFLVVLLACKKPDNPDTLDKDTSYAFGMLIANQMGTTDLRFDYQAFMEGYRDFNEAQETRLTQEQAIEKINEVFARLQAQNDEDLWVQGEKNREEGEAFMAANGAQSGVFTTPSGLQYNVITQGSGEKPGPTDYVSVHYEGTLINGEVFDSSYMLGQPVEFPLDEVIAGWTEGLQLMNEGSVYRFVIPSDLAYGPRGTGPIPPGATLVFTVELLSIK